MASTSIRSWSFALILCCYLISTQGGTVDNPVQNCQALDPSPTLEPFVDKLTIPKEIRTDHGEQVTIGAYKIKQKLHRDLPPTTRYAYGLSAATASSPGPTLVATAGIPSFVRWENHIHDERHMLAVDYTVMWANPKRGGVPIVTHLHGAECSSTSDGYPDSWYTALGDKGPTFSTQNYTYENSQRPSMLWYHDHTFGITRLNVLSGLAGFFLTKSKKAKLPSWMPRKQFTLPLMLSDKQLFHNGSINFPNVGDSPANHPQWCPEYFGDTIVVNGKAWPYRRVRPQKYRLQFLNIANARVFVLSLSHSALYFIQIGTDGGMLHKSQTIKSLTLAPAERIDCIVDFSLARGSDVVLQNTGAAPFPSGEADFSPPSTSVVMKFIVETRHAPPLRESPVPAVLRTKDPEPVLTNALVRQLFMVENDDADGNPLESLLSNRTWVDPVTETPVVGSTEIWEFINFTPDAHPMHVHLVAFRALNQQPFNLTAWSNGECEIFNTTLDTPGTCFTGDPIAPSENQVGWKDTILSLPEFVTRIVIQWKSHDGAPFSFDATAGPGYVWHCHILDHEDNDMMRPIKLIKKAR